MRSVETGADASRVPPHDLDAERAVIGALLVSETAVAVVAEQLSPEDFYSETHRIIYGSMMRLYSRGDRIDQITLSNELSSINEFERVGGRAYVFQIVESVPTASNAARYAEIVRGKALLRSVIDVGSRITEDAFREPEDVSEALDSAEQLIYGVSNRTLRHHLAPVSELAPGALEMIQRLYEQEGEVTGVETGFEDLDRLTTGFHKSDLVVLAARPAMGKTAMALNAIWHASGEKKLPVAIFSLEMSKEQLVQRLISQTTRIPAQALRSGNVKAEDWPKLLRGVAQVSEAPIWIDDTAGVTLMEMRAKVRRLASQLGALGGPPLSLVVVDYLQLMVGQGSRNDNRQQEIAEISRGLKVLARDLDVPVLAIAQLSRAVESRHDKRPMLSDLRDCVAGDTPVLLADGRRMPVRELVGTTPRVLAMSPGGEVIEAEADLVWSVGRRPVFTVRLASGREIRATARHRLFGADGWIRVGALRRGDRIAVARGVPKPGVADGWPEARLALLGHLIGDGSYLGGHPARYCTVSEENSRPVAEAAIDEFGVKVNRNAGRGNRHQFVLSGTGNRWHPAGVNRRLRGLGVFGQTRLRFSPSRALMAGYDGHLEDETLIADAKSDLFWDRVIEVIPAGEEEVFDLTVPGPASWLADGIVSHNSGAIEQDADMVMFLYRDEYYNSDSDDKGIAEVIVGKHRNGPTGKVQLAWLEQYTKFASLARRG
jgi:replicative DNA helicase